MPNLQIREIEFRAADADGDAIPCTLSSEAAVDRGHYLEVLSHRPGDIDLTRAPLPLLVQHDSSQLNIGLVENIRIEGKTLKGLARFGSGEIAQQILTDIKSGIVRNLSVGYQLLQELSEAGRQVRFAWMPYECSVVSVPADSNAGFYRSNSFPKGKPMSDITVTENNAQSRSQRRAANFSMESERERMLEINAMGRTHNMQTQADRAIEEGVSVDDFRATVLSRLKSTSVIRVAESPDIGMSRRETEQYSFRRALLAAQDPAYAQREAGLEMEASRAAAQKRGEPANGVLVPPDVLWGQRDLVAGTPAFGGNLVGTDHQGGSFIELMRERQLVSQLGARELRELTGNLSIPTQTGAGSAFWIAENGSPTESAQAFGQLLMTPKTVGAYTDYSRKMLLQSSPDVESLVRADLAAVLANAVDRAAFNGSGVDAEPLGILGASGIGSVAVGANGGPVTWAHVLELERQLLAAYNDPAAIGYVMTQNLRTKLKQTVKVSGDTTGNFIWQDGQRPGDGLVNGYAAYATTNLPNNLVKGTSGAVCSAMLFGDFSQVILAYWGGLDLMVDPYTNGTSGGRRVIALLDCDIAIRHAGSFAALKDATTT